MAKKETPEAEKTLADAKTLAAQPDAVSNDEWGKRASAAALAAPATSTRCNPDECELVSKPWARKDHWACEKCGFSTFSRDEATARRPSLNS
jgi:hypothetical protein